MPRIWQIIFAKKGVPFREAHEIVGNAVHHCIEKGCVLLDLSVEDFKAISRHFDADILDAISIELVLQVVITILVRRQNVWSDNAIMVKLLSLLRKNKLLNGNAIVGNFVQGS